MESIWKIAIPTSWIYSKCMRSTVKNFNWPRTNQSPHWSNQSGITLMSFRNEQVTCFKNVHLFARRQMRSQMDHDSITSTPCLPYTIQLRIVSVTSQMRSYTHNIRVQGDKGRRWYLVSPYFKSAITSHHLRNHGSKQSNSTSHIVETNWYLNDIPRSKCMPWNLAITILSNVMNSIFCHPQPLPNRTEKIASEVVVPSCTKKPQALSTRIRQATASLGRPGHQLMPALLHCSLNLLKQFPDWWALQFFSPALSEYKRKFQICYKN